MPLSEPTYFTLYELLYSDVAKRFRIDNFPSFEIVENLKELGLFLDGIREAWGDAIIVNSGYRCQLLNKIANGVSNSVHMLGYAADLIPKNGKFEEFKIFIVEYLKDKEYDQCILEYSSKSQWVHIGLYNNKGQQRKQCFK